MVPNSAEIRARARESLRGNWGKAIGGLLLLGLANFVLSFIYKIPVIGWILEIVLAGPLAAGLIFFMLAIARQENPKVGTVFSGFSRFIDTFLLYLLMFIFTILWTLLFIIPGIIAGYRYSQSYYILRDNPEIGPLEAIRRSKEMMKGHKGRLFVLQLTFIGWFILGIIPIGIGLLWVYPYFLTAVAHFYDDLKNRSAEVPPPPVEPGSTAFVG